MKAKRILAFIIDWNLCGIPALIYVLFFKAITESQGLKAIYALFFILFVFSLPALFVVRDVVFKGRSVAKRLLKLRIIDNNTNAIPSKQNLMIRNLFFLFYPVDLIFLFAINKTIGDIATNTRIVKD